MKFEWNKLPLGALQTNAYIIENENGECIIIDPGSEGEKLIAFLKQKHLTPLAILITHAHYDHIGAVDDIRNQWKCPVYIHRNEKEWLINPALNGSDYLGVQEEVVIKEADHYFEKDGSLQIGPFQLEVLETPGHSPGSVSYYMKDHSIVFSGDALFAGSIGRTDFLGGSHPQLLQSIREKLLVLPEDTVVAPGHGGLSTIKQEKMDNPFLKGMN